MRGVYVSCMKRILTLAVLAPLFNAMAFSAPARAEIKAQSEAGFNVVHIAEVAATPDEIWKRLMSPKEYWSKEHSWSGSAAGFYIEPQAGGCFCELLPDAAASGKAKSGGSVEHMRVIFVQPGKVLRMQGALGPLQSEAVLGTLTVAMQPLPEKTGGKPSTKLSFSYVVGGYMRYKVSEIAPNVDKVIGEQFSNLIKPFAGAEALADIPANWSLDLNGIKDDNAAIGAQEEDGIEAEQPAPKDKFVIEGAKKPATSKPIAPAKTGPAKPDDAKKER